MYRAEELLEQYVAMLTETANGEVPSLPETLAALAAEQEEDASAAKATAYRWRDEYIAFLAESNFTVPTAGRCMRMACGAQLRSGAG